MIGKSNSARMLSVVLLTLVLGAGFLMGLAWGGSEAAAGVVEPVAPAPEPERRGRMIDQVGLDAEQRIEVDRIVEHYRVRMRELEKEFQDAYRPRRGEIIQQTRDSLKTMLSPDQVILYDSLLEARDRERRDREREEQSERSEDAPRRDGEQDAGRGAGTSEDC